MGAPLRVLVVDDQPAAHLELFAGLQLNGQCHLTICCATRILDSTGLCEMGVGVIDGSREELRVRLINCESAYDVVFFVRPEEAQRQASLAKPMPGRPVVVTFADNSSSIDVIRHHGPDGSPEATEWATLVVQALVEQPQEPA